MSVSVEHKEAPFQSQTQHKLEDIMVVQDLKMHFPVTAGLLKRQVGRSRRWTGYLFPSNADRLLVSWASLVPVSLR